MGEAVLVHQFRLVFRALHRGPDEVYLEPQSVTLDATRRVHPALLLSPQLAAALALGLLEMLQDQYGGWAVVCPDDHAPAEGHTRLDEEGPQARGTQGLLSQADQYRATIQRLHGLGVTQKEIAARCHLTPRIVSYALKRWRNGHPQET